ncbi:MAG: FecR family protein, partial [SAR324 cluster bacterium]|nr:FecR family protein [SAR324 cluster bacterium]
SKSTVEYRDGSRVRLFQNSTLVLNLSEEQTTNKRTFKLQLTLKNGSLRGRFVKGLQRTKIRTPTALIGIKGTSVRISENNNKATVSLTEGQVEVSNLYSSTTLNPGQWLTDFDRNTDLTQNVTQIPNLLFLKTAEYELDFRNAKSKQLDFSVQLQNSISGKSITRSGQVIFESDYKNIRLPKRFMLNDRGFARVLIGLDPPSLTDPEFKGLITIRAFMDGEGFDDVTEGHLVLKILNLGRKRTLLLDPDKGVSIKED